jgi:hypothetical protein
MWVRLPEGDFAGFSGEGRPHFSKQNCDLQLLEFTLMTMLLWGSMHECARLAGVDGDSWVLTGPARQCMLHLL